MSELMFPKTKSKKKRKRHGESILHQKDGTCYLCLERNGDWSQKYPLHKHHIFGGANRNLSEEDGLYVWLCIDHHETGKSAVHNSVNSAAVQEWLHKAGQEAYERDHSRQQFMERYGKNYL